MQEDEVNDNLKTLHQQWTARERTLEYTGTGCHLESKGEWRRINPFVTGTFAAKGSQTIAPY